MGVADTRRGWHGVATANEERERAARRKRGLSLLPRILVVIGLLAALAFFGMKHLVDGLDGFDKPGVARTANVETVMRKADGRACILYPGTRLTHSSHDWFDVTARVTSNAFEGERPEACRSGDEGTVREYDWKEWAFKR